MSSLFKIDKNQIKKAIDKRVLLSLMESAIDDKLKKEKVKMRRFNHWLWLIPKEISKYDHAKSKGEWNIYLQAYFLGYITYKEYEITGDFPSYLTMKSWLLSAEVNLDEDSYQNFYHLLNFEIGDVQ